MAEVFSVKLIVPSMASSRSSAGFLFLKVAPPTRVVCTTEPSARLNFSELWLPAPSHPTIEAVCSDRVAVASVSHPGLFPLDCSPPRGESSSCVWYSADSFV